MTDNARTAQELADARKRISARPRRYSEDVNECVAFAAGFEEGILAALAALASQAGPYYFGKCRTVGYEYSGDYAPAQAEQSEDGRDAARWREVASRFDAAKSSYARLVLDGLSLEGSPHLPLAVAIDAAIAAKEQQS